MLRRNAWIGAGIGTALFVLAAGLAAAGVVFFFGDRIALALAKPAASFAATAAPERANYHDAAAWNARGAAPPFGAFDIFYLGPGGPVSSGAAGRGQGDAWNGVPDAMANADPFADARALNASAALWAPRYRFAASYALLSPTANGLAALSLAYEDVEAAFDVFLANRSEETTRPFVLIGAGQGGVHALGLLQRRIARDQPLRRQMAGAYILNAGVATPLFTDDLRAVPPCAAPRQTVCVVAFTIAPAEREAARARLKARAFDWRDPDRLALIAEPSLLCTSLTRIARPPLACEDGLALTNADLSAGLLTRRLIDPARQHGALASLAADIAVDAGRRAAELHGVLEAEANILAPIENAVELGDSPVNKVQD